jgi:hypothetical protein
MKITKISVSHEVDFSLPIHKLPILNIEVLTAIFIVLYVTFAFCP